MTDRHRPVADAASDASERLAGTVREVIHEVKPHLRGWLHAATAPLALAAGIVLVVLSPTPMTRIGSGIFAASALALFTASAIYAPRPLVARGPGCGCGASTTPASSC